MKHKPTPRFRAVIFDIDGTLMPLDGIYKAIQSTAKDFGLRVPSVAEMKKKVIGYRTAEFAPRLWKGISKKYIEKFHRHYQYVYNTKTRLHVFRNVEKTFRALRKARIKIGIVTTKTRKMGTHALHKAGVRERVKVFITSDDVKRIKPAPDGMKLAMKRLCVKPSETLVVGDHEFDILAGRRAGCATCGVTTGIRNKRQLRHASATFVVNDIGRVRRIVLEY